MSTSFSAPQFSPPWKGGSWTFLRVVDRSGWRESVAIKLRAWVGVAPALTALLLGSDAAGQSVPAERPRARPPSALTGWADWEKVQRS